VRRTPDQDPGTPSTPTAPTAPSGLGASSIGQTSITFQWTASQSTDALPIAGYKVFQNDELISLQAGTSAVASGLTAGTSYTFYVIGYTEKLDSDASADLVVSTLATDLAPDPFPFTVQAGVAQSTPLEFGPVTITGINGSSPVAVQNGEWAKNGGTPSPDNGYVENNDTVKVYHTSAGAVDTSVNTPLTIGGVTSIATSTTAAADAIPDAFSFPSKSGVGYSTAVTSAPQTITGINVPVAISVTDGTYSINGGVATTAPGTITNGQTVTLGHTSDQYPLTPKTTTVTIAGVSRTFTSTTKADTQAPSVPFQNPPINVGADGFTVNWQASTDDVEVAGYTVYANGQYKGYTLGDTTFPVSGYPASTSVTFTVRAFDSSSNTSAASNSRVGTTPAAPGANNRTLAGALQVVAVRSAGSFSVGGDLTHGQPYTIKGSGFGTKLSQTPLFHWNGDSSTPSFFSTQGTDQGFRASGASGLPVVDTQDPTRLTHYWAARRDNNGILNIFVEIEVPASGGWGDEIYSSHSYRASPTWASGTGSDPDKQFKPWAYDHQNGFYTPPNLYIGYAGLDASKGNLLGDDYRWNGYTGNLGIPYSGYGADPTNPTKGWVRLESILKVSPTEGYNWFYETTTVGGNARRQALPRVGDGNCGTDWALTTTPPTRTIIMLGGYVRDWGSGGAATNYMYFTDMFVDRGSTRVVLGNANTLAACTMLEPQGYTAWSDTSITIKANCGGIPAGQAWLYVMTGPNTILSGFPLEVTIA
jgi:hypothetical protein